MATVRELKFAEDRTVKALAKLVLDQAFDYRPKRVVSIIGSSRSGSTVFKHALCLHPELTCLAGEEEPYYKLARCGYPWDASDEFHGMADPELIRRLISTEIGNQYSIQNRAIIQELGIEEPPFVEAIECRKTPVLVLKTPQNCYRRGVIEQLYPDAEVVYIRIRRDPRATINGLIDGWESGMFTARWTEQGWWCFDMPPGWCWGRPLVKRCIHQWQTSKEFLVKDYGDAIIDVRFEDFEGDWLSIVRQAWDVLGLSRFDPPVQNLPALSVTDPPEKERWRKKRPWLTGLNLKGVV